MMPFSLTFFSSLSAFFRSRYSLCLEILALRQQLCPCQILDHTSRRRGRTELILFVGPSPFELQSQRMCPNLKNSAGPPWVLVVHFVLAAAEAIWDSCFEIAGSRGAPLVAVMKPADLRNFDHGAKVRRLSGTRLGRIFSEGEVKA